MLLTIKSIYLAEQIIKYKQMKKKMLEKSGKTLHEHFLAIKGDTRCMSIIKVHCNQNVFTRLEF